MKIKRPRNIDVYFIFEIHSTDIHKFVLYDIEICFKNQVKPNNDISQKVNSTDESCYQMK